jgi:transposase
MSEKDLEPMSKTALIKLILAMQDNIALLNKNVENLTEEIRVMNQRAFGRKTETAVSMDQLQMDLGFNEAEKEADKNKKEPDLNDITKPRKPKTKGDKEKKWKKITNHRDEYIGLTDEELNEKYGPGKWKKITEELVYKLEHHPAAFDAVTYHIGVYAKDDNQTIVRAPHPTELFPKSIATPSLVASIINAKYVNAVPLYRLETTYKNSDVDISRATMANWIIKTSDLYLKYYYDALKKQLVLQPLLHADETPCQVIRDGRPANTKSYMWVYRTNPTLPGPDIVLYQYCKTRSHENPAEFLKDFTGTLVTDGFSGYHALEKENPEKFTVAGCWIHTKRKFADVVKANGKEYKNTLAAQAVKKIQTIFHEEDLGKDLPPEEHLKRRQEVIKILVDDFFTWVKESQKLVDSESKTGQGFTYALNQEQYLRVFLSDPNVPMGNNYAEQAIRPFTTGRKNWMFFDTPNGAESSAIIYSLVETAKANNLKTFQYFNYLLEELPKIFANGNHEIPDRLLPWSPELPADIRK